MAKKSVENRNEKRKMIAKRFKLIRDQLRKDCSNIHLSPEERWEAMLKQQALPRDSSPSRCRNRCNLKQCSRPRGYNRLTGLCRLHMRPVTLAGLVPGMRKASW
jgi:small subunit ribosomal protein S14